jgi:hypothetical protein
MTPDFLNIWDDGGWNSYKAANVPLHTRRYYKVRSIVRVAFWAPITYLTFVGILVVFA